jgi:hypothetical protein
MRNGMICLGSSYPSLGYNLSLYSEVGRVHGGLVDAPTVYMCQSLWTVQCHRAEEALGIVRLLCSDTLRERLRQLGPTSPGCTFWRLLGGEGGWLNKLTCGLGSP